MWGSRGIKTLIPEGLANIKPTDPFRLANQTARRNRSWSDSSGILLSRHVSRWACKQSKTPVCLSLHLAGNVWGPWQSYKVSSRIAIFSFRRDEIKAFVCNTMRFADALLLVLVSDAPLDTGRPQMDQWLKTIVRFCCRLEIETLCTFIYNKKKWGSFRSWLGAPSIWIRMNYDAC